MKVFIEGYGEVNLNKKDFVDSGGEGDIYIKNDIAHKIYHKQDRMIPIEKINELKCLTLDNIIKPEQVIYNVNNVPVGYTMKVVSDFYPLSRIMTNDFRQQHNIDNDKILNLIMKMKQTIDHIHENGCLFVDANEMNFLISQDFNEVFFIDIDSYKTKNNKASAYTEITLDPHVDIKNQKSFTEKSDWFSFGILACKIFTGIHPYKGKFKNKDKMSLKERMNKSISIFNKDISIPRTARSIDQIPNNFKQWFIELFENNKRLPPPSSIEGINYKEVKNMLVKDLLSFNHIKDFSNNIQYITSFDDHLFVKTEHTIENINHVYKTQDNNNTYPLYSFYNGDLFLKINDKKLSIFRLSDKTEHLTSLLVEDIYVQDNLIVGKNKDRLFEINLFEKNNKLELIFNNNTNIYEKSLKRFNNVFINKLYDKNIVIIPMGNGVIFKENISELENCRIIDAKYQNKILGVSYYNENKELINTFFRFDSSFLNKDIVLKQKDKELDFIVTEKGVLVVNNKNKLYLSSNTYGQTQNKIIYDKNLFNIRLYSNKNGVFAISKNSLYTMTIN